MSILNEINIQHWNEKFSSAMQERITDSLENGNIIYLPQLPFAIEPNEVRFLSPNCADGKAKNISYDGRQDKLQGFVCLPHEILHLKHMLRRFSEHAYQLIVNLFPEYSSMLQIARTSYRPVEIKGRKCPSYRKDDTRLHVDAFPSNPNQGRRILRVFTNINPYGQSRVWRVGAPFEKVAQQFLPLVSMPIWGLRRLMYWTAITKSYRTDYDHIMLQIHNTMKGDLHYQATVPQQQILFPPGSTWIVQTDDVSHAAIEGQFVLEQTFYLPVSAMKNESRSPLRVLERLTGRRLV